MGLESGPFKIITKIEKLCTVPYIFALPVHVPARLWRRPHRYFCSSARAAATAAALIVVSLSACACKCGELLSAPSHSGQPASTTDTL